jgi:3-hydroxyisobutyrate dehydrogenase-like beta-hydroxyacid dehydrogenase
MHIAVAGIGTMGSALVERLVRNEHQVGVWNRTPDRARALREHGATVASSPDELADGADAIFLCLADDDATLDVAAPGDRPRPAWSDAVVVNTGTVSPETMSVLRGHYADRFVGAPIMGGPAALRSGDATFIVGGPAPARAALDPIWDLFAGPMDAGESPERAAAIKLLHNHLLLTGLAVVSETVRIGRGAGVQDETLAALLRQTPLMAAGLRNRVDGLFDPEHPGWFSTLLGAKDLGLAAGLASGESLPVTEAARVAYLLAADAGWSDADVTAIVEGGRSRSRPR